MTEAHELFNALQNLVAAVRFAIPIPQQVTMAELVEAEALLEKLEA